MQFPLRIASRPRMVMSVAWLVSASVLAGESASAGAIRDVRPAAQRHPKPSYEVTVESVPDWVFEEEPDAASVSHRPKQYRSAKPETYQTHFRGHSRAKPEVVQEVYDESNDGINAHGSVVISSTDSEIMVEDALSDGTDPIYSQGVPASENDGFQSQVLHPVEVIDGEGNVAAGQTCTNCGTTGEGICDCVYREKGCDRDPCPCPTDEVLSYYRCQHYGYYPTFWRPWPEGWLKYRPQVPHTLYDRFRKTQPGYRGPADADLENRGSDMDLDRELQDLLRDNNSPQTAPPGRRRTPELLPEDAMPEPPRKPGSPKLPPPKLDDQSNRSSKPSTISRLLGGRNTSSNQNLQRTSFVRPAPKGNPPPVRASRRTY
ncbi:MAG: hypothetical protein U1D30_15945 [Planctomycetota bacterium]